MKINSIQAHEEYFDNILSSGYVPTVTLPTRLSNNSSLIDNVFTTNLSPDLFSCVLDVHISDHQPVILFSDDNLPQIRAKYITIKTNTEEARKQFHNDFLSKQVFHQLDSNIHVADPNQNYGILEKALKETHLVCFPERVVKFNKKKHKKTPWITVGILKSINRRNKLYKSLKKTQLNSISDTMTVEGHDCSDRKAITEEFNNFFATVGERNGHTNSEGDSNFRDYLTHKTDKIFSLSQIDNTATIRIINNIKISQSKGHDGISSELVKLINNDISHCITLLINQSLIGYEPADLTVHPPPRTAEGGFIFFV